MKIKLNPALKKAFYHMGSYFKNSIIFKFIIFKPFLFLIRNITRIYKFLGVISNSRIYKLFRFILKLFAICNIILGFGIVLSYKELNLQEPMIILTIIYASFIDFFNNNFIDFFRTKISYVLRKVINKIDNLEPNITNDSKVESKNKLESKEEAKGIWKSKTKPILTDDKGEYKSLRNTYKNYNFIDESKPFYYNPYFYVPFIAFTSTLTIYFCYSALPEWLTYANLYYILFGADTSPRDPDHLPRPDSSPPVPNPGPFLLPKYNGDTFPKDFRDALPSDLPESSVAGPSSAPSQPLESASETVEWEKYSSGHVTPKVIEE